MDTRVIWYFLNNFLNNFLRLRIDRGKNPHDINPNKSAFWDISPVWSDGLIGISLQGACFRTYKRANKGEMSETTSEGALYMQKYCSRCDIRSLRAPLNWFNILDSQFPTPDSSEAPGNSTGAEHPITFHNWSGPDYCLFLMFFEEINHPAQER
jgi:hypothetical protein